MGQFWISPIQITCNRLPGSIFLWERRFSNQLYEKFDNQIELSPVFLQEIDFLAKNGGLIYNFDVKTEESISENIHLHTFSGKIDQETSILAQNMAF